MKCIFLDSEGNCHTEEHRVSEKWKVDEETKKLYCLRNAAEWFTQCPRYQAKMLILTKK